MRKIVVAVTNKNITSQGE